MCCVHALRRARHGMPKPNPRVSGVKLGLVLFGMHAADALGLLRGASGPFMGHCAMKIEKITTILIILKTIKNIIMKIKLTLKMIVQKKI